MARYVALLRGINVGTTKRIAMADLRALLEAQGWSGVRTLLNSGNAVFEARAAPPARLAGRIHAAIADRLAHDVLVIVKPAQAVAAMVAENTLAADCDDPSRLLVALTQDPKEIGAAKALARVDFGREKLLLGREAAYLWCPDGFLKSRAATALLGQLEHGTTRNWTTMTKIDAMLRA